MSRPAHTRWKMCTKLLAFSSMSRRQYESTGLLALWGKRYRLCNTTGSPFSGHWCMSLGQQLSHTPIFHFDCYTGLIGKEEGTVQFFQYSSSRPPGDLVLRQEHRSDPLCNQAAGLLPRHPANLWSPAVSHLAALRYGPQLLSVRPQSDMQTFYF